MRKSGFMEWLTNEIIFYVGLCVGALSAIILVVYLISYKFRKMKMLVQLNKEYGEATKINKRMKKGEGDVS